MSYTHCCVHHTGYCKLSSACVDRSYHHPQTTTHLATPNGLQRINTHLATPNGLQRINTQLRYCVKMYQSVFNDEIKFTIVKNEQL